MREKLFEIAEHQGAAVREHTEGRIVAHGAHGFGTAGSHRVDDHLQFFLGVAKGALSRGQS